VLIIASVGLIADRTTDVMIEERRSMDNGEENYIVIA